jgi:hypothetical protein
MQPYCKGTARIRDRATETVYAVESDELDWEVEGTEERQMGPEIHHEAVVEHPQLGKLTWSLWEYPQGVENHNETDVGKHEVVEDFQYGLKHVPEE